MFRPRSVDHRSPRPLEHPLVQGPETGAVVEVSEVGELVTESIDEAGILERPPGRGVSEADAYVPVRIADAVAILHAGSLRVERAVAQAELPRDSECIGPESIEKLTSLTPLHGPASIATDSSGVKSTRSWLEFDAPEKQSLLEANSVSDRMLGLARLLRFRLAEVSYRGAAGLGDLH